MKKKNTTQEVRRVVDATRDAVVVAAARARTLKKTASQIASEAGKRWEASKPRRQKAQRELKEAARQVVAFGRDVRKGLKEGFAEAKKGGR